MKKKAVDNYRV